MSPDCYPQDTLWSAQQDRQLEGRIRRPPQKKIVHIYRILADGTSDMFLNNIAFDKAAMHDAFVNASPAISEQLSYLLDPFLSMLYYLGRIFSDDDNDAVAGAGAEHSESEEDEPKAQGKTPSTDSNTAIAPVKPIALIPPKPRSPPPPSGQQRMLSHSIITTPFNTSSPSSPSPPISVPGSEASEDSELEEDVPKPQGATPTESRATLAPAKPRPTIQMSSTPPKPRAGQQLMLPPPISTAPFNTPSSPHPPTSVPAVNNITTNHLDLNEGDTNHFFEDDTNHFFENDTNYFDEVRGVDTMEIPQHSDAEHDNKLDALGKRPRGESGSSQGHSPPSKPPAKRITGGGRSWANKVRGGEGPSESLPALAGPSRPARRAPAKSQSQRR
jgi:hypothetical protein